MSCCIYLNLFYSCFYLFYHDFYHISVFFFKCIGFENQFLRSQFLFVYGKDHLCEKNCEKEYCKNCNIEISKLMFLYGGLKILNRKQFPVYMFLFPVISLYVKILSFEFLVRSKSIKIKFYVLFYVSYFLAINKFVLFFK